MPSTVPGDANCSTADLQDTPLPPSTVSKPLLSEGPTPYTQWDPNDSEGCPWLPTLAPRPDLVVLADALLPLDLWHSGTLQTGI